ncbi:MAG TPA: metal-dependent hydrolase [Pirellulaceae bacterium]|nr:metal-dependent hydrolase [Pirellulaceae bacterium]
MAGFRTHITVSTVAGVGYATGAWLFFGMPLDSCIVAGGLCSIAGMLPDLDSDSGVPVREMISLLAAAVPMMMINRFRHMGWSEEAMACASIVIYCILRFGVAKIFKHFTVHRGMWHSVPACAIAALLTFLIASGEDLYIREFKACAVALGFMSHLVLDEIWSVKVGAGGVQIKRSFGTAVKFWSDNLLANAVTYGKLVVVALLAMGDPVIMERFKLGDHGAPQMARGFFDSALGKIERVKQRIEQGENWRLVPRDAPTPVFSNTAPAKSLNNAPENAAPFASTGNVGGQGAVTTPTPTVTAFGDPILQLPPSAIPGAGAPQATQPPAGTPRY